MNREVHVRFWESEGVRFHCATHLPPCLRDCERSREVIGRYINFYNTRRPHSSHQARTPHVVYFTSLPQPSAKAASPRRVHLEILGICADQRGSSRQSPTDQRRPK